jgi:ribosomal protein S18 acetylase RimI-like enzyme
MIQLKIRSAIADDLSDIVRIEKTFGAEAFSKRSLRRLLPKTIVVDYDGVIAYCTFFMYKKAVRIYNVAVDDRCRRQGLAKKLMREVEALSLEANKDRIILEVASKNAAARTLYESIGFEVVDELLDYYDKGKHALKMEKKIVHLA